LRTSLLVVVVEDEPLILEMVREALEEAGFEVLSAASSRSAQEKIEAAGEIVGLITDVRLGQGPDGWELARAVRSSRPNLPVVYMTGDSAGEWSAQGVPRSLIVQKPFAVGQIVAALTGLLNELDSNPACSA
jgi:two-component system, OmpR family, response regulator